MSFALKKYSLKVKRGKIQNYNMKEFAGDKREILMMKDFIFITSPQKHMKRYYFQNYFKKLCSCKPNLI